MEYYLEKVGEDDKKILYRLLQYSLFEESLNDGNDMNDDAIFDYKYFERYFTDDDRVAFLIKEKSTNNYMQKNSDGHSIAEFMIIPKYRKNNIGKRVAFDCFNMFPGNWEVSPSIGSDSAYQFWYNVINEYTNFNNKFEDRIFIFNNE